MANWTEIIANNVSLLDKRFLFTNIPFIVVTIFIIIFYLRKLKYLIRARVAENMQKDRKIRILVYTFINIILLIEFASNVCAALSGLVYGFLPSYNQNTISHTNSCQVNVEIDFQMQLFPRGWFAYLPGLLTVSTIQLLQPTVSLLLNVLRRAYLDFPYRDTIKRWMCIILLRATILFVLLSYYQTVYIGISILPILYIIDFIVYIKYSRGFYSLLKSRMEVARVQSSREEFRQSSIVFLQYRITSRYTTFTFFILTMKYCIYGIRFSSHGCIRVLCLLNAVTLGYSPLVIFDTETMDVLNNEYFYLFVIFHCLDFLYQILVLFAYCSVCIAIAISLFRQVKRYKQVNKYIHPLLDIYHGTINK